MRPMAEGKCAEISARRDELFRTTVENLPINLVLYDREYRILYMNPTLATICAAICRRPPEELVGLRGAELWPPPIWEPLFEHTERAVATRERQTYELATNLPGRGPSVREWTVVPLVDASGEVDRMLAMSVDVTAQPPHGAGAARRGSAQERVHRRAVPRAAQPAGGDPPEPARDRAPRRAAARGVAARAGSSTGRSGSWSTWSTICSTSRASRRTRSSCSATAWTSTIWCARPSTTTAPPREGRRA